MIRCRRAVVVLNVALFSLTALVAVGAGTVAAAGHARRQAKTYQVGPTRAAKSLSAVLPGLKPGDVVEIDPGTYKETARIVVNGTRDAPITIRGAAGATRPVFDGQGQDTSGRGSVPRGIFQIEGAYLVIEHLEFVNARNGENAAGVRLLGSTNAVIRDCKISQCDMGVFGDDRETATIENSEVCFNGTASFNGYSHNFYMHGNRVAVRGCYIHDSLYGQNYKSRAHYNELWFNQISHSNEGEVGCVDAPGATDRPNSNVLMVGNVVVSRPDRTGNPAKYVLFGTESGSKHNGTLFLFHNTFVAGDRRINFVTLADPQARAVIQGNLFLGSTQFLSLPQPPVSITASHNALPQAAPAATPAGWTDRPGGSGALDYTDGDGRPRRFTLNLAAPRSP